MKNSFNFEDGKKKFYKRWWFLASITLLVFIIADSEFYQTKDRISVKASENENSATANKITNSPSVRTTGNTSSNTSSQLAYKPSDNSSKDSSIINTNGAEGPIVEDKFEETVTDAAALVNKNVNISAARDNTSAVLTTLNSGTFKVGKDIPAGRYVITGNSNGNLFISNDTDTNYISEVLGGGEFGVDSVTTDIQNSDTIEISGIKKVTFTPAETVVYKDSLTTGIWIAGIDVAPGSYNISSAGGSGNIFVYDKSANTKVNEILGGDYGVKNVTANLQAGDTISVSGLNKVNMEADNISR